MKKFSALIFVCSRAFKRFFAVCLATIMLLAISSSDLLIKTQAAGGDLDNTFGVGGKVSSNLFKQTEVAKAIALQNDGKIVVAGDTTPFSPPFNSDFALARYNSDGSLDETFGNGGKVATDFDTRHADHINALVIQSDGKILAAGFAHFRGSDDNNDYGFALARYNSNGTLDATFGNGGKVITNISNPTDGTYIFYRESIHAIAIQNDGKIVATGSARPSGVPSSDFATLRYNANGSLDSTFGNNGKVFMDFPNENIPDSNDAADSVIIQNNGKIVVGGRIHRGYFNHGIVRYNSDGTLDSSFGNSGRIITDFPRQGYAQDNRENELAIQNDSKIILAGFAANDDRRFSLARFNENGTIDNTFGSNGRVFTDLSGAIHAVKILNNGKIIAAGATENDSGNFALAQYNSDGSPDTSFGNNGTIITDFAGGADRINALAIQGDGKILAAGSATNSLGNLDFAVARYLGSQDSPPPAKILCIQDDKSSPYLEINLVTGEYVLTRCNDSWLIGTGTMTNDSANDTFTLSDIAPDRNVQVSIDLNARKAQATLRTFSPQSKTKIKDKNIDNNTCSCK